MRCTALIIIVGAMTTVSTVVSARRRMCRDMGKLNDFRLRPAKSATPDHPLPGLLYPRGSESREVKSLDGLWDFAASPSSDISIGLCGAWFNGSLSKFTEVMQMPVPSSYNDVTTSKALRDHVGAVWYEKTFFVPESWSNQRVFVRFGSVNYFAQVWVNGIMVTNHEMGHLPFEAEVTSQLSWTKKNRITVVVDNVLSFKTVPQGDIVKTVTDNGTINVQTYTFDFFNYAGIHRPVLLHTKPRVYVADVTVKTQLDGTTGLVNFSVQIAGLEENEVADCNVVLRKHDDTMAVDKPIEGLEGTIVVPEAKFWWPRGMHPEPAYLYTLEIAASVRNVTKPDIYRLPIGIRSIRWTNTSVLFNEKPLYMRGFGRHEDSVIRGRGFDLVTMTRDYELLKWIGANAYRTSHYPYSEEVLDMADRQGILIIDECPAVHIDGYTPSLLVHHKSSMSELIRRDKNRPSVVLWSIANEPRSQRYSPIDYFQELTTHTRSLDNTRPLTAALNDFPSVDRVGQFLDVIGFNRYNSWYTDTGRLDMIVDKVVEEAVDWHEKYNKSVIIFGYGADTMPGLHELPSYVWSEEYQKKMFSRHFMAFDRLRLKGFFIGEFIWNFADFRTTQTITRVGGNKKGIFTRTREPKMVAHHVRKRYHALGVKLDGSKAPNDLENYISGTGFQHDELSYTVLQELNFYNSASNETINPTDENENQLFTRL